MATTALDIITQALRKAGLLGIGQTPNAEDTNDAFTDLNDMIAQWRRKRWLVWHLIDVAFTSTGQLTPYTIGPGGQFNVTRPDRLEAAFFRQTVQSQPSQIDYPLELIEARETYNQIALKKLTSFPSYVFYDSDYPLGYLYFWPIPQATIYEMHVSLKQVIDQFSNLTSELSIPPEFIPAMKWNLAQRLRASYQMPPIESINGLAKDSLNLIRNANTQIPRLTLPVDIIRPGIYNPFSDQIR